MTTVNSDHAATVLPASLTPAGVGRLAALVSASPGAQRVTTTSPYTGAQLADLPVSTPDDVEEAFARARAAQVTWAAVPVAERQRIMLRFHDLVLQRQEQALDLMQAESGKTRRDAFLEVSDIAITAATTRAAHADCSHRSAAKARFPCSHIPPSYATPRAWSR